MLAALAQQVWARLLNARDPDEAREEARRRPYVFDDAFELLMEQVSWWLQRSQLQQKLAMHVAVTLDADHCMTVRLLNLKGEPDAAYFSDETDLLELLAEWMELRSAVRLARRMGRQEAQSNASRASAASPSPTYGHNYSDATN